MKITESMRSGLGSIFHHRLRSFLTMLGVIIGVSSVIMLTSIGEGIKQEVGSQVESLGANLLYVMPGKISFNPGEQESKLGVRNQGTREEANPLLYPDVLDLKGHENILAVTGIYNSVDRLDDLALLVSTTGVDEDYFVIRHFDFEFGRPFSKEERELEKRVAVIGHQANKELFNGTESIGQTFKMNAAEYTVVGILAYKKPENMGPQAEDINVKIFLPVTEMLQRHKDQSLSSIQATASSPEMVDKAADTIREVIKKNHPDEEFTVLKQQDMLDVFNNIMATLNTALGGIAAISLIVGGIGIMNIMLVAIIERTREIGIRKAVGANRWDILSQFLIEAVTLSVTGGLIGLALGIFGSQLVSHYFPTVPTAVSMPAVIISLVFALFIGIFFGVYPAIKASKLDPIEALRSE